MCVLAEWAGSQDDRTKAWAAYAVAPHPNSGRDLPIWAYDLPVGSHRHITLIATRPDCPPEIRIAYRLWVRARDVAAKG